MRRGARAASIPAFIAPLATASRHTRSSPQTTIVFHFVLSSRRRFSFQGSCSAKKGPGVCVSKLITDLITGVLGFLVFYATLRARLRWDVLPLRVAS